MFVQTVARCHALEMDKSGSKLPWHSRRNNHTLFKLVADNWILADWLRFLTAINCLHDQVPRCKIVIEETPLLAWTTIMWSSINQTSKKGDKEQTRDSHTSQQIQTKSATVVGVGLRSVVATTHANSSATSISVLTAHNATSSIHCRFKLEIRTHTWAPWQPLAVIDAETLSRLRI